MKKIKVTAPGKLMLFGEHAVVHGKPCIVTAVDQRMEVKAEFNGVNELVVNAPQLGIKKYCRTVKDLGSQEMPKQVSFIEAAVKRFYQNFGLKNGLNITTSCQFCHTFGFGSSSAVTIATLKALNLLYKTKLTDKQLFDLSFQAVIDIQKVGSGFDLAAALWGGTLYFQNKARVLEKLKVGKLPLIVCYSGVKADTPTLIRQVEELKRKNPQKTKKILDNIEDITKKAKICLKKQDWLKVGRLMNENQILLEELGVSTHFLEKLMKTALESGAIGAKLSGAGGGDNMIALVLPEHKKNASQALIKAGGQIMKVGLNAKGVLWEKN
ncbi:mevalonate kinase [Patescibacteria group bacterium]